MRKAVVVAFILLILTALPLWVLQQSLNLIPENTQPRYILPLLYLLVGVIVFQPPGKQVIFPRPVRLTLVFLLSVSHSLALYTNIRRYVTGLDVFHWNLNRNVEWWNWPHLSPMVLWSIASLSFLVLSYVLVEQISTRAGKSYSDH